MSSTTNTAARKARIKARLAAAEEPSGAVEAATVAHTEPVVEDTPSPSPPAPKPTKPPSTLGAKQATNFATQRPSTAPANYKLHVLTALSLAVLIRITRYGTKALTGQ